MAPEQRNHIGSESDFDWIDFEFITSRFGSHPYYLKQLLSKFDSSVQLSSNKETGTRIFFSVPLQPYEDKKNQRKTTIDKESNIVDFWNESFSNLSQIDQDASNNN